MRWDTYGTSVEFRGADAHDEARQPLGAKEEDDGEEQVARSEAEGMVAHGDARPLRHLDPQHVGLLSSK